MHTHGSNRVCTPHLQTHTDEGTEADDHRTVHVQPEKLYSELCLPRKNCFSFASCASSMSVAPVLELLASGLGVVPAGEPLISRKDLVLFLPALHATALSAFSSSFSLATAVSAPVPACACCAGACSTASIMTVSAAGPACVMGGFPNCIKRSRFIGRAR